MKKLVAVWDRLLDAALVLSAAAIVAATLLTLTDIVGRQFFRAAQGWAIEISEYSLVYLAFLGAAWLLREDGHIKVEILVERFSARRAAMIGMGTSFLGIVVTASLAYFGATTTIEEYLAGTVLTESPLKPPLYPLLLPIPIGAAALCVQFVRRTYRYFFQWKTGKPRRVAEQTDAQT